MHGKDDRNGSLKSRRSAGVPAVAVVVSRYHRAITERLLAGAREAYLAAGGGESGLTVVESPGSFELVALSLAAAETGRFAGVVALGCIVKGETRHDEYIAQAVADGLVGVTLKTGVPVALGVLTVDSMGQARERAGGAHGNKGVEAMEAVLSTIAAAEHLRHRPSQSRRSVARPSRGRGR